MKMRSISNLVVRILLLSLAVLFLIGGPLPDFTARIFPSLSGIALLSETLAQRGWFQGLLWALPPLFFVAMACFKGRFFCKWVCPAGTVFFLASPKRLNMRLLKFRINGILFWIIIITSILGLPMLLWLDPQPVFHRSLVWLRAPLSIAAAVPGIIFPLFILLGLFQPMIWCTHICPAGHLFDLARRVKRSPRTAVDTERRNFLTGLFVGLPLAAATTHIPRSQTKKDIPLLPPGARPAPDFGTICHRCYACVALCPGKILRVDFQPQRALAQWFQPEMNPEHGACEEFCHQCSMVCPSGAIQKLTIDQKRNTQIGIARVNRDACLAWTDKQHCMVCDEFCPYNAIDTIMSKDGIPCPVVDPNRCRGCGFCQHECPATRQGKAIVVHAVAQQKGLPNSE